MGKSDSGPDMLDCLTYLHQMDAQGKCFTTVAIVPDGSTLAPSCILSACTTPLVPGYWGEPGAVLTSLAWPNRECKTFPGALYRLIVDHDKMVSSTAADRGVLLGRQPPR